MIQTLRIAYDPYFPVDYREVITAGAAAGGGITGGAGAMPAAAGESSNFRWASLTIQIWTLVVEDTPTEVSLGEESSSEKPSTFRFVHKLVKEVYKHYRPCLLLVAGTQRFCNGNYDLTLAEKIRKAVVLPSSSALLAAFTSDESATISGGTCTSMALSLAARFMILGLSLSSVSKEDILIDLMQVHKTSNVAFRHIQAVMNQVELKAPFLGHESALLSKVETLSALYGLEAASVGFFEKWEDCYLSLFNDLSEGCYLLRMVKFSESNAKREEYGHSILFIKTTTDAYCYDSNSGLFRMYTTCEEMVALSALSAKSMFGFDGFGIYQLAMPAGKFSTCEQLDEALGIFPSLNEVASLPDQSIQLGEKVKTSMPVSLAMVSDQDSDSTTVSVSFTSTTTSVTGGTAASLIPSTASISSRYDLSSAGPLTVNTSKVKRDLSFKADHSCSVEEKKLPFSLVSGKRAQETKNEASTVKKVALLALFMLKSLALTIGSLVFSVLLAPVCLFNLKARELVNKNWSATACSWKLLAV